VAILITLIQRQCLSLTLTRQESDRLGFNLKEAKQPAEQFWIPDITYIRSTPKVVHIYERFNELISVTFLTSVSVYKKT
jgi:hypothetical protein